MTEAQLEFVKLEAHASISSLYRAHGQVDPEWVSSLSGRAVYTIFTNARG